MRICVSLLAVVLFVVSVFPARADDSSDRLALVIGNAKYPDNESPLKEPINDARDVSDELKRDGFVVETGENLTGDGMRRALAKLYGRVKPGSVVLIFFSGFGVQSARQTYLLPVDAQIWTEADVRRDGFSLETILGEVNSRGAGVKIALLDASRRNPFEGGIQPILVGSAELHVGDIQPLQSIPVPKTAGIHVQIDVVGRRASKHQGTDHSGGIIKRALQRRVVIVRDGHDQAEDRPLSTDGPK